MQLAELTLDGSRLLADDVAGMPRRRRLDEDHPAFLGRRRHVLDASRNHVEVAFVQHDVGAVPIADDENALADEEELVLFGVAVPDELPLNLGDLHKLPVGSGDDPRRPVLGEPLEFSIDVQRLSPSIESRAGKGRSIGPNRGAVMTSGAYDVIVAGVGGMGSAACWQLARRGKRVLGLERFDIPHAMGSSHGINRIIRLAYFEHPSYVPLLRRAYELWREAEQASGERLLFVTGGVDAGVESSRIVQGALQSCREHGLPHETLTATELAARHPGWRLPSDYVAIVQPDAGFVASERAIVAHAALAMTAG